MGYGTGHAGFLFFLLYWESKIYRAVLASGVQSLQEVETGALDGPAFSAEKELHVRTLLSLVEPFAVTVGQVHGAGHHAQAGLSSCRDALHGSCGRALQKDRRRRGVARPQESPRTCRMQWPRGVWVKGLHLKVTTFVEIRCYPRSSSLPPLP